MSKGSLPEQSIPIHLVTSYTYFRCSMATKFAQKNKWKQQNALMRSKVTRNLKKKKKRTKIVVGQAGLRAVSTQLP